MKRYYKAFVFFQVTALFCTGAFAQESWPKTLSASDGTIIKVYQPQPETFRGNVLTGRWAISVQEPGKTDPAFGTFWSSDHVSTDRNDRLATLESVSVTDIRIPADSNITRLNYIKGVIQSMLPGAAGALSLDELLTALNQQMDETRQSNGINTQPPVILYTNTPSVLVTIDGQPKLQVNKKWDMEAVVNSPFIIVKDKDGRFYLRGSGHWYSAAEATGPYTYLSGNADHRLRRIEKEFTEQNPEQANNTSDSAIPAIIVTTTPAELIQTNGAPNFLPVAGTSLLYVQNSPDNIFLNTQTQGYYILISGRWYTSGTLSGGNGWTYVPSDKLPADFAKIPEGSPKDNVLASVAGTDAAREAVMDAQIPQTAKVDRKTTTTQVEYDGDPQFQPIEGTDLQYAINTASTVLSYNNNYYALDNGVWFVSSQPAGPWTVSTERPAGLNKIPPSSPVYNAKFVDVYDVTPDYIYMGYTPGYLNNFLYGPTVVYGTGFYYSPWMGHYYYPRPWSWGFDMMYNPWYGWGFGFNFGFDWFNMGFGFGWGGWYGGWWGPGAYSPFAWGRGHTPHGFYSHYGHESFMPRNMHIYAHNNLYHGRSGVSENIGHLVRPGGIMRGAEHPVFADHQGNVFQRNGQGEWQTRSNQANVRPEVNELNRQHQLQQRGMMRATNFQRVQQFSTPHFGGGFRGGFGGGFHGGFGGGGRR